MSEEEKFFDHAKRELGPKMASSAFVISIAPLDGEIDPKIAMETGYAILLNKPIVVLIAPGSIRVPGLERIATKIIRLTQPLGSDAGQQQFMAELAAFRSELDA